MQHLVIALASAPISCSIFSLEIRCLTESRRDANDKVKCFPLDPSTTPNGFAKIAVGFWCWQVLRTSKSLDTVYVDSCPSQTQAPSRIQEDRKDKALLQWRLGAGTKVLHHYRLTVELEDHVADLAARQLKSESCRRDKDIQPSEATRPTSSQNPDISICCKDAHYVQRGTANLLNPVVIIEVLSPSTDLRSPQEIRGSTRNLLLRLNTCLFPRMGFLWNAMRGNSTATGCIPRRAAWTIL